MSRRQPAAETPAYEPKGCPNGAAPRRRTPLLPRLFTPDLRTGRQSAGMWWQDCERLPYLSPGIPYGPRGRGTLRALLLPPLLPSGTAQGAGARGAGARGAGARGAGARETRQPAARDNPDTFGVLLGKFLPTKFRDFLHQLRAKSAEPEAHPPSAPQYPKGASEHYLDLCPSCSFLPDLWDQSLHSEDSFKEKTTLGPPRGEFITARKANPLHSTQVPKVKTLLIPSPSGEGSRPRRRYCPFRVRFADETLQDTALRYWERNRAVRQNIFPCEQTTLPSVSVSERVLGSVGRWLESLPRALCPRAQDTVAGSSCWNCPRVSAQEPQLYLSEDATMSSRLPFISRATTLPRPRGGLRTFLDTPNTMEQAAIQNEGSQFPRSAAGRGCPLCLGFPGRLQRRVAPRGGSIGLALGRKTSSLARDRKLSLAQRPLWIPESRAPRARPWGAWPPT
ncbi:uncharacterized protein C9orf50 homolog isoform X8 [Peromyscus eremicus]|uniref:uncharacterized protein C9orf50 homolog isoform X8 n=1 Tax=Peromyscus eremicus TaxID=42410 RepID=UPI0027DB99AA|nr:uncharacterized protein C9orf50 homolog isoform X8 [Peromyscus eremicus]